MDVWDIYKEIKGVSSLYDWQRGFLQDKHLIEKRQNFVLWLPTGAGKTLVAELLLLRECLVRRRNCILILPYVAIVQEKIISLAPLEERLGIVVEQYAASKGRFPPIKRRNSQSIYVCTIEKANALVNSLLEQGRLHEVGLTIVDELHMIGESGGRGAVLEQCICKMLYQRPSALMQKSATEQKIQIVGMSATLGNPGELCAFLSARKFHTSFRPVQLVERIKLHDEIYQVDDEGSWQLEKKLPKNTIGRDPDGLVMLLGNLLKGQVLIFCPTKQNCENLCKLLADLCPISFREHRSAERKQILTQFLEENEGRVCPVLSAGIKHGVAYHHSGLTQDERLLVESAYKSGVISIICCTSTLAAGVNLPARRVIVRSPLVGRTPLKKSQYMQMIGRAGRKGLDEKGDSVVILHHGNEVKTFRRMQESPLEPCLSGLSDELQREAFFLDLIVLKICSTIDDLSSMLKNTLFGIQQQEKLDIRALAEQTIQSLVDKQMLIQPEAIYFATSIGKATFNANLNPQMALQMNRDLGENLSQGIVLSSHFHLLYNCVPLDIQVPNLDWNLFHNEYLKLTKEERSLIHAMGFPEGTIIQYILLPNNNKNSVKAQRLYVAFMLRQIWEQRPLWEVAQQFDVTRGWLQSTLQSAVSQSGSIVRFAERTPALWSLRSLLPEMVKRLSECTRQELIPLLAIECVKMGRARQLYEKNYRTVGSIARAELEKLMTAMDGKLNRQQAQRMINSAKNIIRDRIAEKTEELEQLGAGDVLFSTPLLTAENDPNDISLSQNNASNGGSIQPQRMELNRSGLEEEAEEDDEAEEEKHGEEEEDKEEETTTTLFHQTKRKLNFNCSGLEPKEEN